MRKSYQDRGYATELAFLRNRITRGCMTLLFITIFTIILLISLLVSDSALFYTYALPFLVSHILKDSGWTLPVFISLSIILALLPLGVIWMVERWKLKGFYAFVIFYIIDAAIAFVLIGFSDGIGISIFAFHAIVLYLLWDSSRYFQKYYQAKVAEDRKNLI